MRHPHQKKVRCVTPHTPQRIGAAHGDACANALNGIDAASNNIGAYDANKSALAGTAT